MYQRSCKTRFEVSERRRLSFYAAVFDTPTVIRSEGAPYQEIIRAGAFKAALQTPAEVIANLDHDPARTFARRSDGSLLLQEDPHGLYATCWVPETDLGDQIIKDVQGGKLDGCSFRFGPVEDRISGDLVERLRVDISDVCLTSSPAYPNTEVHLLRHQDRTRQIVASYRYQKSKTR